MASFSLSILIPKTRLLSRRSGFAKKGFFSKPFINCSPEVFNIVFTSLSLAIEIKSPYIFTGTPRGKLPESVTTVH
ncbi:hypothetical protein ES708_08209 [subsurface metagenome]